MSYCRWSSDGFNCDVYVYESATCFVCHVAGNRIKGKAPKYWWKDITEAEFIKAYAEYSDFMEKVERVPIDHPMAGETIETDEPGEMATQLGKLLTEGLHVPLYAIAALVEEQLELEQQEKKDGV